MTANRERSCIRQAGRHSSWQEVGKEGSAGDVPAHLRK